MNRLILIIALSIPLAACEKEQECAVPDGEYAMKLKAIEGTCPDRIAKQFEAHANTVPVKKGQQCKRFLTTVGGEIPESKCKMEMEISAEANEKGLHDGQGIFSLLCEDTACRHTFAIEFEQVKPKK